jgi:hypothetical protein
LLRTGDPLGSLSGKPSRKEIGCKVDWCKNPHNAKGYCGNHYRQWKKYGEKLAKRKPNYSIKEGYKYLKDPHKRRSSVAEHRLIMETYLGRLLIKNENVHHINGNKLDNRIENLELWNTHQPKGQRIEDKVKYALEILKQYAPETLKEI